MSRLKETYQNEIVDAMIKKFGYKNIMEVPKLDKIVINMGVGEAKENAKILEAPEEGLVGNGSVVTLDLAGREMTYVLGSRDIAVATDDDVISPESPIGAAIIGAKAGDTVSYSAPNGRQISVTIKDSHPLA